MLYKQSFLLGHNCEVAALPKGAESRFGGLDSILPRGKRHDCSRCFLVACHRHNHRHQVGSRQMLNDGQ